MRLSYEALQQRQEEECTPPKENGQAVSEWLRESHKATKQLLKLKDRLIEVERKVSHSRLTVLLMHVASSFFSCHSERDTGGRASGDAVPAEASGEPG